MATAYLSLLGDWDEIAELGLIIVNNADIVHTEIMRGKDVNPMLMWAINFTANMNSDERLSRNFTQEFIKERINSLFTRHSVCVVICSRTNVAEFLDSLNRPIPLDVRVLEEPTEQAKCESPAYLAVRSYKRKGICLGGRCFNHQTWVGFHPDPAREFLGPECAFDLAHSLYLQTLFTPK